MNIILVPLIIFVLINPWHLFDRGNSLSGCQRKTHLGWQSKGWQNGHWSRPKCLKNGQIVWCDKGCGRK